MSEHSQKVKRRQHPGARRGRARATPKGRQVDPAALDAVRALLENRPRQRDLLIEYLHLIQDAHGALSAAHLAALADEMRLPMAEVYEVATFYAHFDVVVDGDPPPPVTIRVCDSLSCELQGAQALFGALAEAADPQRVRVARAPCMGRCDTAPVAEVGHHHVDRARVETVMAAADAGHVHPQIPDYEDYAAYVNDGGYQLLRGCLNGERKLDAIIEALDESGLRGLGGAGFPTGRKWQIVRGYQGPRLMAVNADEGEVGTFKDRHYLERSPHRFLEGVLVAAWAVEAQAVYIYLRDEYPAVAAERRAAPAAGTERGSRRTRPDPWRGPEKDVE